MQEEIKKVKALIAKDQLKIAITQLEIIFDEGLENDQVCNFSAIYYNIKEKQSNGTIANDYAEQSMNSLRLSMLDFLREKATFIKEIQENKSIDTYANEFQLSLARTKITPLFLQNHQQKLNLNITTIQKMTQVKSRKAIVTFINELEQFELVEKIKINGKTCWQLNEKGLDFFKKFSL